MFSRELSSFGALLDATLPMENQSAAAGRINHFTARLKGSPSMGPIFMAVKGTDPSKVREPHAICTLI